MLDFVCDYATGAHDRILKALYDSNYIETDGYGEDEFCIKAREVIRQKFSCPNSDIYFFVGGTITNLTAISHVLKPYEAVIACETGHISVHETGAIEATGHKVIVVKGKEYKITAEEIEFQCKIHCENHMVKPKMVYISNTTEMGTTYTKKELEEISKVCKKYGLYLYLDGARLSSALTSKKNDIKIEDYSKYCDIFYVGGTKCGLMFGEALIINNDNLKEGFEYTIKQKGGLFAKGRLLGIQFLEFFKDDLYEKLGEHANNMAEKIANVLVEKGFELLVDGSTNQVFVKMTTEQMKKIQEYVKCSTFPPEDIKDNFEIVRFVTAWYTKEEDVNKFIKIIKEIF